MQSPASATDQYFLLPGRLRISIDGLRRNAGYADYLSRWLCKISGIKKATANPLTGKALVFFDPKLINFSVIQQELNLCRAAYLRSLVTKNESVKVFELSQNIAKKEAAATKVSAQPPQSALLYAGATGGVLAAILLKRLVLGRSPLAVSSRIVNLAAITTLISGYPILRDGLNQIGRRRRINADLLIFIATLGLLAMRESITGLSVLWIVHLSNIFRLLMQARTRGAIKKMITDEYGYAARIDQGRMARVALDELASGDVIVVGQNQMVPVDGKVIAGEAVISEAAINGDAALRRVTLDDEILAGTLVNDGSLQIRIGQTGLENYAANIARLVDHVDKCVGASKTSDYYADKLVPWSIGIAILTFLLTRDITRSMVILLAGCPVAVALSRHTALGAALGVAAKDGVLVKDTSLFETISKTDTVVFDKTGTLTAAIPRVKEVVVVDKSYYTGDIVRLASSAAAGTKHPVADMLSDYARNSGVELVASENVVVSERGVKALVDENTIAIGNELFIEQEKIKTARTIPRIRRMEHLGLRVLFIAVNNKLAGLIGYSDEIRIESLDAVDKLKALGVKHLGLVTGDTSRASQEIIDRLGITEHWSAASPADKRAIIRNLQQAGRQVVMIGDGINDAPALKAADTGITIGRGGTDEPARCADAILTGSDLRKIPNLVRLSKFTDEVIRQNLTLSAGLSVIGIALAAARFISPVSAMMMLNLSTVAVLLNSARVLRFKRDKSKPAINLQQFNSMEPGVVPSLPGGGLAFPELAARSNNDAGPGYYSASAASACERLGTSEQFGLEDSGVAERLIKYGYNLLQKAEKPSFWKLLGSQFKDFMVQVLLGAAGLSFVLGRSKDAVLTLAIVVANAILGVVQERRAEKSLDSLQKMAAPQAQAIRNGRPCRIDSEQLVPGDVIILEAGDRVPADARLLTTWRFEVEEASLTGETVPVKKDAHQVCAGTVPLGDRKNMVYMGTAVTRGRATAVVVATGMATEMGKVASMIQDSEEQVTPLQRRLEELGKYLVWGCLAVSGLVVLAGLLRGQPALNMLQTGASLAVAAIPEGLTAIVIIALAMGVQRMSRRNIIVRRLSSIETLGCATVICSDKTGTLTKNEMTVRDIFAAGRHWDVTGEGYCPAGEFMSGDKAIDPNTNAALVQTLLTGSLCNNARMVHDKSKHSGKIVPMKGHKEVGWRIEGDPTEGALVVAAAKAGLTAQVLHKSYLRLFENPFESERRMMSVICVNHGSKTLHCKGAHDKVLEACQQILYDGEVIPLDEKMRNDIQAANDRMTDKALRVLAIAYRPLEEAEEGQDIDDLEQQLVFCGLVGMIDPPRTEVPHAIAKCHKAGVKVVMITGDHPNTARAIAKEINLLTNNQRIVTGVEIDNLSDRQLTDIVGNVTVYARTSPHHKLRIIKALKTKGYIVAMTGDGVNDAPAVKAADIGISMGLTGTDVTKEAASLTLSDDNFATIVRAMEEGRSIYANIRKAIRYLIATNIGEVVLMLLAAVFGLPLPLLPIQLLWINLIGDGLPAVALVNDPPAQNIMDQPPKNADDSVFSGGLGRKIVSRGIAIGVTSLALFVGVMKNGGNLLLARTLVIAQLAISQFIHIFDCRLERYTGKVSLFSNKWLVAAVALSMGMVVGIVHIPALQPVFGTISLTAFQWLMALAIGGLSSVLDFGLVRVLQRIGPKQDDLCSNPSVVTV